ncbi:4Fe-4S dicluster domain-containing protein [Parabacteroides sp. 52]|uniref:4Fe-4S binding protein n=1 Tax=unclassified Parabacteroides TaxID=2649774 RepID=UPI0013D6CB09|nr:MULTISPECIES: 4Fe-4S binding protein [unclassified Parabacteroides]MDH6533587.1 ferredoxin [Parabacteroides sp. PM5-20]NDV54339.1 4Fe-4S dicluster domain-containing protein [Parabacteroides sp. 52]
MKRTNYLKGLRVILAILFFVPILLYFVDFRGLAPDMFNKLLHIQIVPALISGTIAIWIFQFLLALLFGRIYCSVICPAGILQDIINRIFCIGKKKKKGSSRFVYHKPHNILRYGLMAVTFLLFIWGSSELLLALDPYSNFGRIATNLFRPVAIWGNNLLAEILAKVDNYTLFHMSVQTVTTGAGIAAGLALLVFIGMVLFRGRLFCNTLCPVGALLSLVSRYSLFRVVIDKDKCIGCGLCEKTCKAEAISTKEFHVDSSRCVDCFNCVSSCKKDSIHYRFAPFNRKAKTKEVIEPAAHSRRQFLATGTIVASSLPLMSIYARRNRQRHGNGNTNPITPPGSHNLEQFKDKCTGCHICVAKCPSQVLYPAGMEFGFGYFLKPHMSYINSYCNYECTICADVCPNHALDLKGVEEKVTTQVGVAEFFINRCIVKTENTDCGACSEHCPTQAVHMVPYKDTTLTIPQVEPQLCIGCGGCESICPVRPKRAIIVKANTEHAYVEKPKEEEVLDIVIDDFGF